MVATVSVRALHGASPGLGTDVTGQTIRLKQADNDLQDDLFPVPIPASGDPPNFSYRKVLQLVIDTAPDNRISNLRFFSDGGSLGTGRRVLFRRQTAYTQPNAADTSAAISAVDVTTLTDVSPEVIEPGELVNDTDSFPTREGAAGQQDHVELQLEVTSAATPGNSAGALVMRFRYTET